MKKNPSIINQGGQSNADSITLSFVYISLETKHSGNSNESNGQNSGEQFGYGAYIYCQYAWRCTNAI